jgi:hypothetical protein
VHVLQRTQFALIKNDEIANASKENNGYLSYESYVAYVTSVTYVTYVTDALCRQNADYLVLKLLILSREIACRG